MTETNNFNKQYCTCRYYESINNKHTERMIKNKVGKKLQKVKNMLLFVDIT